MKQALKLALILLALAALSSCPAPSGFILPTTSDQTAPGLPSPNYSVRVLDSIGGSALVGALVTVSDGTSIVASGTTKADGVFSFYFDPVKTYTVTAGMADRASSKIQGLTKDTKDNVALYCHKLGMVNFPATAPTIQAVQYSTNNGATFSPVAANTDAYDALSWQLRVTAVADSAIEATAWSGFGLAASFDRMPTSYTDRYETTALPMGYTEQSAAQPDGTFRSTAYWDYSDFGMPAGNHILYIICYDVANNRAEMRIPVTSSLPAAGAADISSTVPGSFKVRTDVTPLSRNTFSDEPGAAGFYHGQAISYRAYITFNMGVAINGFSVLRSEDGVQYVTTGTVQNGGPKSGSYTYFETDPSLEIGKDYWYKVVGFNAGFNSAESATIKTRYLPPHTASLAYPANYATVNTRGPDFKFTISDPYIISEQVADTYHLQLAIKEKAGSPLYRLSYVYDIVGIYGPPGTILLADATSGNPTDYGSADLLSYDNGVFTIHIAAAGVALDPGVTYEWNIFGQGYATSGGPTAAHFRKYNNNAYDGSFSFARSLADEPNHGYDTTNGWFTLTVSQSAE